MFTLETLMPSLNIENPFHSMPLYKHVSNLLAEEITRYYRPGDFLPAEKELAQKYGINRHTVRRALAELAAKGFVEKFQGKRSIVRQRLVKYLFSDEDGFEAPGQKNHVLCENIVVKKMGVAAQDETARQLEMEDGEPVALIECLRKVDGVPLSLVRHYLPLEKVFDVIRLYDSGPLHDFLFKHYGLRLNRGRSLVRAVMPDTEDVAALKIIGNAPLLQVKSLFADSETGKPLELRISRFNGAATQLSFGYGV